MFSDQVSSSEPRGSTGERVLAIDLGERRVGLALAEPGRALVEGLPTIDRKTQKGKLVDQVRGIALELERLANHLGDLGAIAGDIAYQPAAAWFDA